MNQLTVRRAQLSLVLKLDAGTLHFWLPPRVAHFLHLLQFAEACCVCRIKPSSVSLRSSASCFRVFRLFHFPHHGGLLRALSDSSHILSRSLCPSSPVGALCPHDLAIVCGPTSCSLETQSRQGTVPLSTGSIISRLSPEVNRGYFGFSPQSVHTDIHSRVDTKRGRHSDLPKAQKARSKRPSFLVPIFSTRLRAPNPGMLSRRHELAQRYTLISPFAKNNNGLKH